MGKNYRKKRALDEDDEQQVEDPPSVPDSSTEPASLRYEYYAINVVRYM